MGQGFSEIVFIPARYHLLTCYCPRVVIFTIVPGKANQTKFRRGFSNISCCIQVLCSDLH